MADIKIIVGYETVTQADQAFKILDKTVKSTARQYEQAFNKITGWQKKFSSEQNRVNSALNTNYLAQQKSNKSARESARAFELAAKATKDQASMVERLNLKYKPLYATSKQYENSLNEINQAQKLSVLSTKQHEDAVEELNREYDSFIKGTAGWENQFVRGGSRAGKSMNRFGMYAQQVGYQVGDFFVQVQSGQSALVAFGQQGTQLAGLLPGVTGAVVGISLAVGTMLLRSFLESTKASKDAATGFSDFEASLKSAKEETKGFAQELMLLEKGFKSVEEAALNRVLMDAKEALAVKEKTLATKTGGHDLRNAQLKVAAAKKAVSVAQEELDVHRDSRDLLADKKSQQQQIEMFLKAQQRIRNENGDIMQDELDKSKELTEEYNKQWRGLSDKTDLLQLEKVHGSDSLVYLTEQSRLREEAYKTQLEASGLSEDHVGSLVSLNQEMEKFNLELSASTLLSMRLARNLETAASFNTGGVGGEFSNVPTGLDAFGGKGNYKYDESSKFKPSKPKKKKSGGGKDPRKQLAEYLESKRQELELETKLVGIFGDERDIQTELFNIKSKYSKVITPEQRKELENILRLTQAERERQVALEETAAQQQQLADLIGNSMEKSMMGIVDGTMSVKDAFKSMAADVIKELYRVLVVQKVVAAAKGFFGFADGGAFSGGSQVQAYANGGVVNGPTTFGMSGGKTGLMGEAGPEAIMPLKRGSNGKLGVQMEGGGGGDNIVVHQNFNFQSNGDDSIKKLIAQAAPQISAMTKSSLLNDRRRGGATKAAFG